MSDTDGIDDRPDDSPLPGDLPLTDVARLIAIDFRTRSIAAEQARHDARLDSHIKASEKRHAEVLSEIDSTRGEVLRAVGELARKIDGKDAAVAQAGIAAIEATVAATEAREAVASFTNEADETTGIHERRFAELTAADAKLAAADARLEREQDAKFAAIREKQAALDSKLRWKIGTIVSTVIATLGAAWKVYEILNPNAPKLPIP